jgi:hypothetical protein
MQADNIPEQAPEPNGDWLGGEALVWSLVALAIVFTVVVAALHFYEGT